MDNEKMVLVKVDQLLLSNLGFAVLLKGVEDERTLPIIIGGAESQAIALCINRVQAPRPLTHDLLKNVLDFLECRLMKVEISDLKEGTFFANLTLERDGRRMEMDARPSDSIALALRANVPIYVAERVMEEAGRVFPEAEVVAEGEGGEVEQTTGQKKEARKKALSPVEILQADLRKAVEEERYEDAAKLRDEIERLKKAHHGN
ncbi:MAG: bifunctional nuclease family protein [Verrucomicrobiota bacterium]|nr:bifunctional nuclease family protein [Verrucomicrobiota bacterium]